MAVSCGLRFIELVAPGFPGIPLSRRHISPRTRPLGRNLALRGFSAYEIRLLLRHPRGFKCLGYTKWRNSFVGVGNENFELDSDFSVNRASSSGSVCTDGLEGSVGEITAVDSVSSERRLNGLSIVDRSLDYGEDKDVTATETAELRSSNRLERSNLAYFSTENDGVTSLDYITRDEQIFGEHSDQNDRGIAPPVQLGLDDLEYYVPEIGHRVLGVVVAGSRTKFDVDIGAAKLGELKVSKLFPLDRFQVRHNKWIFPEEVDAEGAREKYSRPPHGCPCMVFDKEVFAYEDPALFVIDIGTVLELVVIGKSLSGNPILSARKAAERIAWDRVKQIKELKQPIQVEVMDCNLFGAIAKVEGLRAFLPLKEFINRPKTLEDYIGRKLWVTIHFAKENCHSLVISERKAWVKRNLQPGSLHNGTVIGILPYGVRVQVDRTNIIIQFWTRACNGIEIVVIVFNFEQEATNGKRGLIHISNIAHALNDKITDIFEVGEQVKMMVVNSDALNTISFSTADLESECGLMLRDKERVFQEAERTAHAWRIENQRSKDFYNNDSEDFSYETAPEPIANLDWLEFGQ